MIVYLMAGLGFDKRSFQNLTFPEDTEVFHLDWIDPKHHFEPLSQYAERIFELQVSAEHKKNEIILIGHSFGGVLMQEIAQFSKNIRLVILVSSIKSHKEKPLWMRLLYRFPVYWLLSKFLIRISYPIWSPWYGFKSKVSRKLLWDMVSRFSNKYHRWATRTISYWRPQKGIRNYQLLRIHGTKDFMFPLKNITEAVEKIKGGNHFMVFHEADAVSAVIKKIINTMN
jgi:pimeloyl-ACP methyl ester carboxylesterase